MISAWINSKGPGSIASSYPWSKTTPKRKIAISPTIKKNNE
jgi:hypothetical protein